MADCLKGWVDAAAKALPHLVEDPLGVAARLRRSRVTRSSAAAAPIVHPVDDIPYNEPSTKKEIEIELAIARIERLVEGSPADETRVA